MPSFLLGSLWARLTSIAHRVRVATGLAATGAALLFACGMVRAQSLPLTIVATDQSSLNLSSQFGVPAGSAINQNGDFAFVGHSDTALFLRAAGTTTATRVLQIGDTLPGASGSRIASFLPTVVLNSSRLLLFEVGYDLSDGTSRSSLVTYDGMNFKVVVSSSDAAPGSSGSYGDLLIGGMNDSGDISFASISILPPSTIVTTFYILPSGAGTAKRVAGTNDAPPPSCTWCTSVAPVSVAAAPAINTNGQILIGFAGGLFVGSKDGSLPLSVVPLGTGPCGPPSAPALGSFLPGLTASVTVFGTVPPAVLNNSGAVAFMDVTGPTTALTSAICLVAPGASSAVPVVVSGAAAPAALGGGAISVPFLEAMDNSQDILFSTAVGGGTTPYALMRYEGGSGQLDAVAYNGETVGGQGGVTFASPTETIPGIPPSGPPVVPTTVPVPAFSAVSMANGGLVSFNVLLTQGGSAVYQQAGTGAPVLVAQEGASAAGTGGTYLGPAPRTKTLDNASTFFPSFFLANGSEEYGEFLGTTGSVHTLMTTADTLPSGAQTTLAIAAPKMAGHFVVFVAQPAGGRVNLLESDLSANTTTNIVSNGQIPEPGASGYPYITSVTPNFFVNAAGQVAFEVLTGNSPSLGTASEVSSFSGTGYSNPAWLSPLPLALSPGCGAVYLWSPSAGIKKIAASGDSAPASWMGTLMCASLNSGPPSPMNDAAQVAFDATFSGNGANSAPGNGLFLYSSGTLSEIAATSDLLTIIPSPTTLVPLISVAENPAGQTAFGAQIGTPPSPSLFGGVSTGFQAFFIKSPTSMAQKIVANGDPLPGGSATFGPPHYIAGLSGAGELAFTAGTNTVADGLFFAPANRAIQTVALDGGAIPGGNGGTISLTIPQPAGTPLAANPFRPFALMNQETDIAFTATVSTATVTGAGLFRMLRADGSAPALRSIALPGKPAPGGGTFFATESFSVGPDGRLGFLNSLLANGFQRAIFVAGEDGTVVRALRTGDVAPGGGVVSSLFMSQGVAAGDPGKFAFLSYLTDGSAREAIFVASAPPGNLATTTTLAAPQGPSLALQPVTLTASVTSTAPGTPTGTVTFVANGSSLGAATLNAAGQAMLTSSSLTAGPDSIVAQYGGDSNFAGGSSAPMTVVAAGFAPPPSQLSVTAGQSLVVPLTVYAPAGANMNFMLSCSGLPANTGCAFDVNPVSPSATGTTVKLTLTTMAHSSLLAAWPQRQFPSLGGIELAALLAALLSLATLAWDRSPGRRLASCACLSALAMALLLVGCATSGSSAPPNSSGTPAGPTSFTVTGTSGSTTISTVIKVTVQ